MCAVHEPMSGFRGP
uniref:Uncharacterized protein n=1 Tax=Anguilla anguilla TaxID=7936 RepID=A0A0E9S2J5_ANGAN